LHKIRKNTYHIDSHRKTEKRNKLPGHALAPFNGMRAHCPSCCILGHISPMSVFAAMMDPRKWDPKKKICPSQS
ncbi:hypothetical protein OS493_016132, partial [Desmophyllum pertusum]